METVGLYAIRRRIWLSVTLADGFLEITCIEIEIAKLEQMRQSWRNMNEKMTVKVQSFGIR